MPSTKAVTIHYYALLREQRGVPQERLDTTAATAQDLYNELHDRHGFTLGADRLRVVVNEEFVGWDRPLNPGDVVVFIPPVAGG